MSHDDDAWLAALAGRGHSEDKEIRMLREIMLDAEQRKAGEDSLDHDWQRLRFALRREARKERPAWLRWPVFAQAAALLLVVGAVAMMSLQKPATAPDQGAGEPMVMRGRFTQEIAVAEPAVAAAAMAGRLRALGVAVESKQQSERSELRVKLSYPVTPAVQALFAREQIELPQQGDLYLLFVPAVR